MSTSSANILTVDVEDYFMSPESIPVTDWPKYPCRIEIGVNRLLTLFREYKAKTTWFFLGWVAERYPHLAAQAAEDGHELAVHGYDHRFVTDLTQEEFRSSLDRTRAALLDAAPGAEIVGHRAPAFSLRRDVEWHWQTLRETGFTYDSSLMPYATYLYGDRTLPTAPYVHGGIVEFPPAAIRLMGKVLPVGGGGVLRAMPRLYLSWARSRYRYQHHLPPVIHIHPWELDSEHPQPELPLRQTLIHGIGLRSVESKLRSILEEGSHMPLRALAVHYVNT